MKSVPLLERLRFCEIYRNNLEEFTMKRWGPLVTSLRREEPGQRRIDGESLSVRLDQIRDKMIELGQWLGTLFEGELRPQLREEGVELLSFKELSKREKKVAFEHFEGNIYPILTPLSVDIGHPFPFISNLSKSLAIRFHRPKHGEDCFARVKIPQNIPQWIPTGKNPLRLVHLDDLIKTHLNHVLKGCQIQETMLFRITRTTQDEAQIRDEHEDMLDIIEDSLKERMFAPVVLLEYQKTKTSYLLDVIRDELEVGLKACLPIASPANTTSFRDIFALPLPHLKYPPRRPLPPLDFCTLSPESPTQENPLPLFSAIRRQNLMAHHPYESFESSVEEFIRQAAFDPKVMAIKLSLYRTDSSGGLITYLLEAAKRGKQVVVVIELKASFDEERNIHWAHQLEDAGVHVTYGPIKKKTHSKMTLVIRKEEDGIRTYAHLGTGNYNPQTSRFYEDLSLFTCCPKICNEVIEVFNHLTGQSLTREYKELLVAPFNMKKRFLDLMDREIKNREKGRPAHIIAKMNQIEDPDIIEKLYEASRAKVPIDLIVRGLSCLRPALKGVSSHIRVVSLIGKYLEHSRIFYFANGEKEREKGLFYMGSADWMYRNLHNRVEVVVPIREKAHRERLAHLLTLMLDNPPNAWKSNAQGLYTTVPSKGEDSQKRIEAYYDKKKEEISKSR